MTRNKNVLRILLILLLLIITFSFQKFVSPVNAAGLWTTVAPLPEVREGAAGAAINGLVYVMKGYSFGDTGDVRIYNPATNIWTNGNPSFNIGSEFYQGVAVNGKAYVIGGRPVFTIGSLVDVYNPATNFWSQGAPMPTPRAGHATVVVNGLIYVIGGRNGGAPFEGLVLSTVEAYNPATNSWSTAPSMPTPRSDLAAAVVGGLIYAIGGWNGISTVGTVEAFNPATGAWTEKTPMPTPRGTLGAGVCGSQGTIRAIGGAAGFGNSTLATNEAYNPVTNSWSQDTPLNVGRGEVTLVNSDPNTIYAAGGGFFGISVSDTEVFHCPSAPVTAPGISLSASLSTLSLTQGGTAGSNITVTSVNGFKGKVSLSATPQLGLNGITTSFNPSSLTIHSNSSSVSALTVTASATSNLGTFLLAVTATDGKNVSSTLNLLLMMLPSATTKLPDFTIAASPSILHLKTGSEGIGSLILNSINGFSGSVSLTLSTSPPGPAVLFTNRILLVPDGASSTLFAAMGVTAPDAFVATVVASAPSFNGTIHHSVAIRVLTQDFSVFSPLAFSTISIGQGFSATSTITTSSINGLNGTVSFSVTPLPPGITVNVNPSTFSLFPNSTFFSTMIVSVAPNTPGGTFNIAVAATGNGLLRGFVFTLIVPDFSISASTSSLTLTLHRLIGANATLTVMSFLGFSLPANLSTSWLGGQPGGVTISLLPGTVRPPPNGSSSALLSLTIAKGATLGTFTLQITGSVPNLARSVSVTVTIVK